MGRGWHWARCVWLWLLVAVPYCLLSRRTAVAGQTNAYACVALGLGIGATICLLNCLPEGYVEPTRLAKGCTVAGISIAAPFAVIELAASPITLLHGYEFARNVVSTTTIFYSDVCMVLGYWPLLVSGLLFSLACGFVPGNDAVTVTGEPEMSTRAVVGAALTGILIPPLTLTGLSGEVTGRVIGLALQGLLAFLLTQQVREFSGRDAEWTLIAYGLGAIAWNCFGRIAPLASLAPQQMPVLVMGCAAMALLLLGVGLCQVQANHVVDEDSDQTILQAEEVQLNNLKGFADLTPSEERCIRLLAEGRTQTSIAEELGKAPSTVRVLLGRGYKKLGVSGVAEFDALIHGLRQREVLGHAVATHQDLEDENALQGIVSICARVACLLMLLLPPAGTYAPWGYGQDLLLCLGLGFVAAGVWESWFRSAGDMPVEAGPDGVLSARVIDVLRRIMFVVSGLAATALRQTGRYGLEGQVVTLVLGILASLFAFEFAITTSSLGAFSAREDKAEKARKAVFLAPSIAVLICATQMRLRPILVTVCLLVIAFSPQGWKSRERVNTSTCPSGYIQPFMISMGIITGFAFEELWRAVSGFSVLWALVPFEVALFVSGLVVLRRNRGLCLAIVALAGIVCLQLPANWFVRMGWMSATLSCSGYLAVGGEGVLPRRDSDALMPSLGIGLLAGCVGINTYGDLLQFNEVALSFLGGKQGLISVTGFILGSVFTIAGIMLVMGAVHLSDISKANEMGLSSPESSLSERARNLLVARGLSQTEVEVLLLIAAGKGRRQISEELNYSLGAINSARLDGYRKLAIHGRRELLEYICAGTGLVNND